MQTQTQPTAKYSAVGVGGWVTIIVKLLLPDVKKLLSPDIHLNILMEHLNLLLTKSRVYNTISDYHDNRLSHVI